MSRYESITELEVVNAPWGKELTVSEATYDGGFKTLHIRIKEGKRFTDLELDGETAQHMADLIGGWAKNNAPAE